MKTLYFATGNEGKFESVKRMLSDVDVKVERYNLEHEEKKRKNIRKIATFKVIDAYWEIREPCLASDAGFFIPDFDGFPGALVDVILKAIGVEGIIKLIDGETRKAKFKNAYAWYDDVLRPKTYAETVRGKIIPEKRGERGDYFQSDLYYIFIPEGKNKTLAEMSKEEYEEWAHEMDEKSSLKEEIKDFLF